MTRQSNLTIARLCLLAAAFGCAACDPIPIDRVDPTASPVRQESLGTAGQLGFCAGLSIRDAARVLAAPVAAEAESSGPSVCTLSVGAVGAAQYRVALRVEDVFEDLASVEAVFGGGTQTTTVGDGAYWAPEIQTLWVLKGQDIYAIQVMSFPESPARALQITIDLARLLLNAH